MKQPYIEVDGARIWFEAKAYNAKKPKLVPIAGNDEQCPRCGREVVGAGLTLSSGGTWATHRPCGTDYEVKLG